LTRIHVHIDTETGGRGRRVSHIGSEISRQRLVDVSPNGVVVVAAAVEPVAQVVLVPGGRVQEAVVKIPSGKAISDWLKRTVKGSCNSTSECITKQA
jgi:hypothetical protein